MSRFTQSSSRWLLAAILVGFGLRIYDLGAGSSYQRSLWGSP